MATNSGSEFVSTLHAIRNRFDQASSREKVRLLTSLADATVSATKSLRTLHSVLCYLRAFPDNEHVFRAADTLLGDFGQRIKRLSRSRRNALDDSGIAGTTTRYEYSYHVAKLLSKRYPANVDIDWPRYEEPEKLDEILCHTLAHAEEAVFEEGEVSTRQWVRNAKGKLTLTDLAWLLIQLENTPQLRNLRALSYDAAAVPLVIGLGSSDASITHNRLPVRRMHYRHDGMRPAPSSARRLITCELPGIRRLPRDRARRLIDTATTCLAVRHREVYSITHGNPDEVYEAPLGCGVTLGVIGVLPEHRLNLEANYGYLLFANGMPVGYGGVSPLFRQANTGVNIFEEYRRSEAAFLFAQTLRAFRTLFGVTRFVANPYQFGEGNLEAIGSGAFWFYYKLGFRPADAAVARLADREWTQLQSKPRHRSDAATLKRLAHGDLHLTLPGARKNQLFEERGLYRCALGITSLIAEQEMPDRRKAVAGIVARVAETLSASGVSRWPASERRAFVRLAPVVGLIEGLDGWPAGEKRKLVSLMRAKGGPSERVFAHRLRDHDQFRAALTRYCKNCAKRG